MDQRVWNMPNAVKRTATYVAVASDCGQCLRVCVCVCVCARMYVFAWFSQHRSTGSLNSIKQQVFLMDMECVLCAVETGFIQYVYFRLMSIFKGLLQLLASLKHAQSKTPADFVSITTTRVSRVTETRGYCSTAQSTRTHSKQNYGLAYPQWRTVKSSWLEECNNPHVWVKNVN
jgi:hypothetical protein